MFIINKAIGRSWSDMWCCLSFFRNLTAHEGLHCDRAIPLALRKLKIYDENTFTSFYCTRKYEFFKLGSLGLERCKTFLAADVGLGISATCPSLLGMPVFARYCVPCAFCISKVSLCVAYSAPRLCTAKEWLARDIRTASELKLIRTGVISTGGDQSACTVWSLWRCSRKTVHTAYFRMHKIKKKK